MIVLNHRFDPEPLEFSVFTAAYHLDICKLKRPKVCMYVCTCGGLTDWLGVIDAWLVDVLIDRSMQHTWVS